MKPAIFVLLALPLALSARADFDPNAEITCRTQSGKKVVVNDEFAGKGRALVTGSKRAYYATYLNGVNGPSVQLTMGVRALAPEYTLRLDPAGLEITSRKEGNEMAQFYYIPAQLVSTTLWSGEQEEAAKCIQAVK